MFSKNKEASACLIVATEFILDNVKKGVFICYFNRYIIFFSHFFFYMFKEKRQISSKFILIFYN